MTTDEPTYDKSYFIDETAQEPTAEGRIVNLADVKKFSVVKGAQFQPVMGQNLLINYIQVEPHSPNVPHAHEEEQIFILLEGEMEFTVGDETRTIRKGDIVVIPPWVRHGGGTRDSSAIGIDVFNPPRRQLKEMIEGAE